jgi:hypothetical protein
VPESRDGDARQGVTDQDREIAVCPRNSGLQAGFGEPPQLIDDGAGFFAARCSPSGGIHRTLVIGRRAGREELADSLA